MKIVHISDTHGLHEHFLGIWLKEIYAEHKPDIIAHSGDFMQRAMRYQDLADFLEWFMKLPFQHKILVPGNHDVWCQQLENNDYLKKALIPGNLHLLINEELVIDGVKFWGSPYTPEFMNWGFQLHQHEAKAMWSLIPDDTNVLITHGPAKGILDYISLKNGIPSEALGCHFLKARIQQLASLKAHLFGHIHGGYGKSEQDGYVALNSAILNEKYKVANKPQLIEIFSI